MWAGNYEANATAVRREVSDLTYRVWRVYLTGCAFAFAQNCLQGAHRQALNPTPWSRGYIYGR